MPAASGAEGTLTTSGPRHSTVRAVLALLGLTQVANGGWALLAPRSFYAEFPFGRGWVELLPGYSEHLVRDVGSLYLATAAALIAAAILMTRAVIVVACVSWLAFALPHAIYHAFNLEPFATGDAIANALVLAVTVGLPVWVLAVVLRGQPRPVAPSRATSNGGGERITGVGDDTRNPLVRACFRESRRRYGEVMAPLRVFAHHPKTMVGYAALELAAERSNRVPLRLKHLGELRAGMICGCEWCLDFGSSISGHAGVTEDELRDLPRYWESPRFTPLENLVLDYATGMSGSPVEVDDALFAQLQEHFDEAQLVELTTVIALENYRARFNWAFGIASQGFSEGSFCLPAVTDTKPDRAS